MDRAILHLDIPAFPVAVERVVEPRLRFRPVAVAPSSSTRAAILVSSLEARRAGVFRGMPLERAVRICRDLIVLPPNEPLYRRAARAVLGLLGRYSPLLEPAGAGHVFLDLTGTTRLFGYAADSADRIQREVRDRLRLAATLGVASNKLVSRVAARVIRPERLYDVFPGGEAPFLAPLYVDLLPAVDPPAREILSEVNIARVHELSALDLAHLRLLFGRRAWRFYREARGIDHSPVRPPEAAPAVREEESLPEDSNEEAVCREALDRLSARAAARVRAMGMRAGRVAVGIHYADGVRALREERPVPPLDSEILLRDRAARLFERARQRRIQVRHLEVVLSDLASAPRQLPLFEPPADRPKQVRQDGALNMALDRIRERYGVAAVGWKRKAERPVDPPEGRRSEATAGDKTGGETKHRPKGGAGEEVSGGRGERMAGTGRPAPAGGRA